VAGCRASPGFTHAPVANGISSTMSGRQSLLLNLATITFARSPNSEQAAVAPIRPTALLETRSVSRITARVRLPACVTGPQAARLFITAPRSVLTLVRHEAAVEPGVGRRQRARPPE